MKMSKWKLWELTDGTVVTVESVHKVTGVPKSTIYHRLSNGKNTREEVFALREPRCSRGEKIYTLTDGSEWTATSLAKHLNCKKATAQSRFYSRFGLDPVRILKPVKGASFSESCLNDKRVRASVQARMWYDIDGFWKLFNKMDVKLST